MLELKNVKRIYQSKSGAVTALNGVSITFPQTGMVFITGKSGCGKTTLLNVIGGLDGIDDGEISLLGKPFKDFSTEEYDSYRNTFIGFVFQEYNLLNEYTVEKNIRIAMELQGQNCDENEFNELLSTVEITELKNRKPNELSGGQRQRVAIARALVKKPRIIIADEPTGALDSNTGIQVLDILKKLSKNKLIIVVSHDQEFAEKYADRIIRLVDGNITEDITFNENEIETNLKEKDDSLIIKDGATLSQTEKDIVADAIKNRKKLEIIEKLSYREKQPTGPVENFETKEPLNLKKSQMKFGSALSLGLKSLGVKPLRLIFTIFLSAIAFAVFGLFDTIANFSTANVINNQLKKSEAPTVMTSAKYVVNNALGDEYTIRLSDEKVKELEKSTGSSAKGIYHYSSNVSGSGTAQTIIEISTLFSNKGKNYYTNKIDGLIEFSKNEISSDGKISPFNYQIVEGKYPALDKHTGENPVAISTYLAESILYYLNGDTLQEQPVNNIHDLIDKEITVYNVKYKIVGLIDCGEIPEKYAPLINVTPSNSKYITLANDFSAFINSTASKCLFVPEGYREHLKSVNPDNKTVYYAGDSKWIVNNYESSLQANKYVYSVDDFSEDNILLFSGNYNSPLSLKDDEVIVHIKNFNEVFSAERKNLNGSERIILEGKLSNMQSKSTILSEKRNLLKECLSILNLEDGNGIKNIKVTKTENITDNKIVKDLKVVGVYLANDNVYSYRLMMNDNLMNDFNIYSEQGDFARLLFATSGNIFSSKKIAEYMCKTSGLSLNWYGNSVISTISQNEQTIRQSADLFLYASIVLALFSVFMFFNYVSTSVVNKRPTIGILRCLGSNGKNILTIFTIESIIMAIVNGLLATAFTAIGCIFVNMYINNVMNIGVAFAIFGIRQFIIICTVSLVTAIISSAFPIIKISKEKPVDLIRKP